MLKFRGVRPAWTQFWVHLVSAKLTAVLEFGLATITLKWHILSMDIQMVFIQTWVCGFVHTFTAFHGCVRVSPNVLQKIQIVHKSASAVTMITCMHFDFQVHRSVLF